MKSWKNIEFMKSWKIEFNDQLLQDQGEINLLNSQGH